MIGYDIPKGIDDETVERIWEEAREAAQQHAGFTGDVRALRDRLRQMEDLGADEVHLVPTCGDPEEVERAADAIA